MSTFRSRGPREIPVLCLLWHVFLSASRAVPGGQEQWNPPAVLLQRSEQPCALSAHSSMSVKIVIKEIKFMNLFTSTHINLTLLSYLYSYTLYTSLLYTNFGPFMLHFQLIAKNPNFWYMLMVWICLLHMLECLLGKLLVSFSICQMFCQIYQNVNNLKGKLRNILLIIHFIPLFPQCNIHSNALFVYTETINLT